MPEEELKAMWKEYGQAMIEHHRRNGYPEPFVAWLAREEGWDAQGRTKIK